MLVKTLALAVLAVLLVAVTNAAAELAGTTTHAATTTEAAGTTTHAATNTEAVTTTKAAGTTTHAAGTTTEAVTTTKAAGTTTHAAGTTTHAATTTEAVTTTEVPSTDLPTNAPKATPWWNKTYDNSTINERYKGKGMPPYQIFIVLVGVTCVLMTATVCIKNRVMKDDNYYNPME